MDDILESIGDEVYGVYLALILIVAGVFFLGSHATRRAVERERQVEHARLEIRIPMPGTPEIAETMEANHRE